MNERDWFYVRIWILARLWFLLSAVIGLLTVVGVSYIATQINASLAEMHELVEAVKKERKEQAKREELLDAAQKRNEIQAASLIRALKDAEGRAKALLAERD